MGHVEASVEHRVMGLGRGVAGAHLPLPPTPLTSGRELYPMKGLVLHPEAPIL